MLLVQFLALKYLPNNFPHEGNSGSPLERQQTDTHKGMFTAFVSVVDSRLEIMVFTLLLSRVFSIRSSSPALISWGTDTKRRVNEENVLWGHMQLTTSFRSACFYSYFCNVFHMLNTLPMWGHLLPFTSQYFARSLSGLGNFHRRCRKLR